MENEIWRDVPNYEGIYQVSNYGRLKSFARNKERMLPLKKEKSGYLSKVLYKNKIGEYFTIHQLVAICFLNHTPNGYKYVIDHINNNRSDNRLENLQILTHRENIQKGYSAKDTTSKYMGVSWYKQTKKWKAGIVINGKVKSLGYFTEEYDAHLAYQKALEMYNNGDLSFMQPKKYSSEYRGVTWNKKANKWQAVISVNKKNKYLGIFNTEEEAYNKCKIEKQKYETN